MGSSIRDAKVYYPAVRKGRRQGSRLRVQGWVRKALSPQRSALLVALVALVSLSGATVSGHDIPNDVTVQTLVKPEGQRLRLVVRVPLQAMRDMDYPKPAGTRNTDLLDLSRADATLRDAAMLWIADYLDVYENGGKLPAPRVASVRAALQSDRSFASYDEAIAHLEGPGLPQQDEFFWSQGLLDILFEYPIHSDHSQFSINPRLARLGLRTLTVLRFLPPGGSVRAFEFNGDPGLVQLDPSALQAVRQFVTLGFLHILDGPDHLLFLLCLVLPFRRFRSLVVVVTAFTVAHSITLIAAAYDLAPGALWFPPLVETLIATSIVYLALENIVFATKKEPRSSQREQDLSDLKKNSLSAVSALSAVSSGSWLKRRWLVTFAFGLVHGFGFSFALRQTLQFAGTHMLTSLLSFNLGLELGQLLVLALLIPALGLLFRSLVPEQMGTIVISALVAHTAWHWLGERWDLLRRFTFEWPMLDAAFLAGTLRWMMLLVIAAGCYWITFGVGKSEVRSSTSEI